MSGVLPQDEENAVDASMPKDLGFRSDIRTRIELEDLMRLYRGLPNPLEGNKTPNLAMAVLNRINEGCRLHFPGHVLNACEYFLVSSVWCIALPSRVAHWLFDKGYIDAEGQMTAEGKQLFVEDALG